MARLTRNHPLGGARIVVIDDDVPLLTATQSVLAQHGHEVVGTSDPRQGIDLVKTRRPEVVLVDFYMPAMTGEQVANEIRTFDQLTQILLVTGYSSERPAIDMLRQLQIQGYHDKADGPHRLLVLIEAAVKHHRAIAALERQRRALRHILDVAPLINRLQPIDQLFELAVTNLGALVGGHDAFVATANHGIFVLEGAGRSVSIRAGTGRFEGLILLDGLAPGLRAAVDAGLEANAPFAHPEGYVVVPLRTNAGERGCMVITSPTLPAESTEACAIFATQIVQSIENNLLYARATVDPLTEAHTRDFGFRRLADTIAVETQHGIPTTVLMVDIDHFKQVNDRYGHAAGDLALRTVTRAIRGACRQGDVVSRYGGEEFLVVLPATPLERARIVAERIRLATNSLDFYFEGASIPLTVSVGLATGPDSADRIVRRADRALYQAKANGRNQVVEAEEAAAAARAA